MDVMSVIVIMFTGLWLFLPAMVPNSAAVVFGGKTKIDFGRCGIGERGVGDGEWRTCCCGSAFSRDLGEVRGYSVMESPGEGSSEAHSRGSSWVSS